MDAIKDVSSERRWVEVASHTAIPILLLVLLFLGGCGHPKQARSNVPPPPLPEPSPTESTNRPEGAAKNDRLPSNA
ncbi:MAG: hypothetical protein WBV55_12780, partial [Candidatus Sulfotelmatobacter sp.]